MIHVAIFLFHRSVNWDLGWINCLRWQGEELELEPFFLNMDWLLWSLNKIMILVLAAPQDCVVPPTQMRSLAHSPPSRWGSSQFSLHMGPPGVISAQGSYTPPHVKHIRLLTCWCSKKTEKQNCREPHPEHNPEYYTMSSAWLSLRWCQHIVLCVPPT